MNWPKTIPFGAIRIKLQFVPRDTFDGDRHGDFAVRDGEPTIRVEDTLKGAMRDTVIFHELVHAWLYLGGMKRLEEPDEESICDVVASGVIQMIGKVG